MRTIPTNLQAHLSDDWATLAICARVTRRDGLVLGLTTALDDLRLGGVTYHGAAAIQSTALHQSAGGGIDNLTVQGLLSSDRITDADLRGGYYDGAELLLFLCDYRDLSAGTVTLLRGHLGNVTITDGQYQMEVRALSQHLAQQVGDLTSLTCRVKRLGDSQCKLGMSGSRFTRSVLTITDEYTLTFGGDTQPSGYYGYGLVTWQNGLNVGLSKEIKQHTLVNGNSALIVLQEPFPQPVVNGDVAILEMGCDRTWARCQALSNAVNFRGEPHLPGVDQLIKIGRT